MTARGWLRAGLIFLTVGQGLVGAAQLLLPRAFYDDFPWPGHPWVSLLPPYNEHLMRDVGAGTLSYVFLLGVAAATMERRLVRAALGANLVFSVPHLIFHANHLAHFPPVDAVTQTVALAAAVAIPIALLLLSGALAPANPAEPGEPPQPSRWRLR
ncbi:hypothetical protein AB0J90_27475 [Micromonospora sp. NPDC049523]|uniref:hypothetical protein n=1 Tax=Micromonospora sp. NPDC049523 TaxID=3155921 RepID=UPI00341A3CCA